MLEMKIDDGDIPNWKNRALAVFTLNKLSHADLSYEELTKDFEDPEPEFLYELKQLYQEYESSK